MVQVTWLSEKKKSPRIWKEPDGLTLAIGVYINKVPEMQPETIKTEM